RDGLLASNVVSDLSSSTSNNANANANVNANVNANANVTVIAADNITQGVDVNVNVNGDQTRSSDTSFAMSPQKRARSREPLDGNAIDVSPSKRMLLLKTREQEERQGSDEKKDIEMEDSLNDSRLDIEVDVDIITAMEQLETIQKEDKSKKSSSETKTYQYVVCTSRCDVFLMDTISLKTVDRFNDLLSWCEKEHVMNNQRHRLEYVHYIEELSIVLIGSGGINRIAVLRIALPDDEVRNTRDEHKRDVDSTSDLGVPKLCLEGYYPKDASHLANIYGMSVLRCGQDMWRVFLLHVNIHQSRQLREQSIFSRFVSQLTVLNITKQNNLLSIHSVFS
ncbi:hypothetical protein RFI_01649, partial [Reticulomyxa filosa]